MTHRIPRTILDMLLVGMLVFEMFYILTGNALHEIVGALFFVTLIVHMIFSRRFISGLWKKAGSERGLTGKQKAMSVVMVAMLVVAGILLASSILISKILTAASGWMLPATAYNLVTFLHMVSAYVVCGVTVVHIGLHWISLFKIFNVPYNPARRSAISTGVTAAAALGVIAVGAVASKEIASWGVLDQMLGGTAEAEELKGSNNSGSAAMNNGAGSSSGDSSTNNLPNSGTGTTPTKRDKGTKSFDAQSAPQGGTPSVPNSSQGDSSSSGNSSSSNGSSSTVTGYCTLCHRRCPLSAPECNKPYQAGLL